MKELKWISSKILEDIYSVFLLTFGKPLVFTPGYGSRQGTRLIMKEKGEKRAIEEMLLAEKHTFLKLLAGSTG